MDTRIAEILARLGVMEERLTTLNHEYGEVVKQMKTSGEKIAKTCTDVEWLKRFFWLVATASISSLIAIVWQAVRG